MPVCSSSPHPLLLVLHRSTLRIRYPLPQKPRSSKRCESCTWSSPSPPFVACQSRADLNVLPSFSHPLPVCLSFVFLWEFNLIQFVSHSKVSRSKLKRAANGCRTGGRTLTAPATGGRRTGALQRAERVVGACVGPPCMRQAALPQRAAGHPNLELRAQVTWNRNGDWSDDCCELRRRVVGWKGR